MPEVIVVHTTESDRGSAQAVANYLRRTGNMSHEVYDPWNDETVVLLSPNQRAKALLNEPGGVETNNRETDGEPGPDVYQVEVVGRAADVPRYSDAWHRNLAQHLRQLCWMLGVPLEFPCAFVPYPQSYGKRASQRLSFAAWNAVRGIVGHQHVPENNHGDPGDISRTITFALTPEVYMGAPIGAFDVIEPRGGEVRVAGWAFDPDDPGRSIDVHVYINGIFVGPVPTNKFRPDVNSAHGISGNHGFDAVLHVPQPVAARVDIYAIDTQDAANNRLIGQRSTVVVK